MVESCSRVTYLVKYEPRKPVPPVINIVTIVSSRCPGPEPGQNHGLCGIDPVHQSGGIGEERSLLLAGIRPGDLFGRHSKERCSRCCAGRRGN